jgi:hypothetical protein
VYRGAVRSPANLCRFSVFGGYLWLALAAQLLLLAFVAVAVVPPVALIYAVIGVGAFVLSAILLTHAPSLTLFFASTAVGLLSTLAGLTAAVQRSALPVAFALVYTATSVAATVVSAAGARLTSRLR